MLRQIYRIALTGFLFSLFGLICSLGNLIFIPIVILRLNKIKLVENFCRDLIHYSWGFFIFCTKIFGYLDYEFDSISELGTDSQLIVANHPSLLDVVFIVSKVRRVNCIVKDSLSKNLFLFAAIRAGNYIPNTNNEELLKKSVSVLKNGESLLIFPEGTRTKDKIVFHKAASYIGINGAKDIVCLAVLMSPKSLRKNEPWYLTPKNMIKYKFYEIAKFLIKDFCIHKPNPLRARLLHSEMVELYEKELYDTND